MSLLLSGGKKRLGADRVGVWVCRFGLIGSTEFAEDFPEWLQEHVVAYLNVDVSASSFLSSRWGIQFVPRLPD